MTDGNLASWPEATQLPYPGDDPAAVRQTAAVLRDGRRRLDAFVGGLDGALSSMMHAWQGANADSARAEVGTLVGAARGIAERAENAAAAMDRHGDDLERIRRRVDGLRSEWTDLQNQLLLSGRLPLWSVSSFVVAGESAGAAGAGDRSGGGPGPDDPYAQLRARWRAFVQEQEDSARSCAAALARAGSGDWQYAPGTGTVRGDLAAAIGLAELTFDDRLGHVQATQAWSVLTAQERALFLAVGDDHLAGLAAGGPAAAAQIWRGLDPMVRQALIHARPQEIGTIDGLPVADRDQANRILLPDQRARAQAEVDALRAEAAEEGYLEDGFALPLPDTAERDWLHRLATAIGRVDTLDDIAGSDSAGVDAAGVPRRTYLLALDVAERGRVAVAYGNPDTADQVVSLVPGTGSDLGGVLGDGERIKLMMQAAERSGAGTVAGVVWTDWATPPNLGQAAFPDWADRAADDLGHYADGLRSSHEGDEPFRSVIAAHSYGTVLAAKAASGAHTLNADALILLGSPGTNLDSVRDVQLTGVGADDVARHVFATTSDADLVGDLPQLTDVALNGVTLGPDAGNAHDGISLGFSGDPSRPDWGATVFHTPANHSLGYYSFDDHSRYWDPESPQLLTMGDIIADRYHGSRW